MIPLKQAVTEYMEKLKREMERIQKQDRSRLDAISDKGRDTVRPQR